MTAWLFSLTLSVITFHSVSWRIRMLARTLCVLWAVLAMRALMLVMSGPLVLIVLVVLIMRRTSMLLGRSMAMTLDHQRSVMDDCPRLHVHGLWAIGRRRVIAHTGCMVHNGRMVLAVTRFR